MIKSLSDIDVLIKLESHQEVLKFLVKLSPSELSSFAELQEWSAPMLTVLRDHPDVMRILRGKD